MPESGSPVQKRILILLDYHLQSLLHVSHRILGVFLAGRQRSAGSCIAWSYHPIDDGYPNYWYQQLTSAGLLHQSTYHLFQFVDLFTGILLFENRILDKKRSWKCKTIIMISWAQEDNLDIFKAFMILGCIRRSDRFSVHRRCYSLET